MRSDRHAIQLVSFSVLFCFFCFFQFLFCFFVLHFDFLNEIYRWCERELKRRWRNSFLKTQKGKKKCLVLFFALCLFVRQLQEALITLHYKYKSQKPSVTSLDSQCQGTKL